MRFGNWRGVAIACALTAAFAAGQGGRPARADLFHHTFPREVEAVDVNTGGPYMAPPVPYGHYAKGGGHLGKVCGLLHGGLCGLGCKGAGCGSCGGDGCGDDPCGGGGGHGLGGLFHKKGCGDPCGGDPCGGDPCGACGGSGCGFCHGMGLLKKGCGIGGKGCGIGGGTTVCASAQAPVVSPQCVTGSPQCGDPGCRLLSKHWHRRGRGCTQCNGTGCGICQSPGMLSGNLCDSCHGSGCGSCGGRGLFGCGDPGRLCGGCGGRGCGLCKGGGLMKASHSIMGLPHALVAKAFHVGEIKYFVGPGGPVPLTPGYVPYVVTTRSPRDYFAFPPFVDTQP